MNRINEDMKILSVNMAFPPKVEARLDKDNKICWDIFLRENGKNQYSVFHGENEHDLGEVHRHLKRIGFTEFYQEGELKEFSENGYALVDVK